MDNELLEICKRLGDEYSVYSVGPFVVTRAERIDGGWELRVVKQQQEKEATDDNN